jgi:hypothetical protein
MLEGIQGRQYDEEKYPCHFIFWSLLFNDIFNIEDSVDNRIINEYETVGGNKILYNAQKLIPTQVSIHDINELAYSSMQNLWTYIYMHNV